MTTDAPTEEDMPDLMEACQRVSDLLAKYNLGRVVICPPGDDPDRCPGCETESPN